MNEVVQISKPHMWMPPLFYEALSGEFLADPDRQPHTLGKLAIAAFHKGIGANAKYLRSGVSSESYKPSWAPEVKATVFYRVLGQNALVKELDIQTGNKNNFVLLSYKTSDSEDEPDCINIKRGGKISPVVYPLAINDPSSMEYARAAIQNETAKFFAPK